MNMYEDILRCDGCGIEIRWQPVRAGRLIFCCSDCQHGRPCECVDLLEFEDERREGRSSGNISFELNA